MLPINPRDYRALLWAFVPALLVSLAYARPDLAWYLLPLNCYFALTAGLIAHNHNHRPVFGSAWANARFSEWLSIFYGYPVFAWVPTHNMNHHRHVNGEGDATITWRFSNRHNLLVMLTYFFVSAYYQSGPINSYIARARERSPRLFRRIVLQYAVWLGTYSVLLVLAILLHGLSDGAAVWAIALLLPSFFSLYVIMVFNYEQHVHADSASEYDHTRSFTGPIANFLLFNAGYHTAHHEDAGTHWSQLPAAHRAIESRINPALIEKNVLWYFFRQYLLAPFIPSLGTRQIGADPRSGRLAEGGSFETKSRAA